MLSAVSSCTSFIVDSLGKSEFIFIRHSNFYDSSMTPSEELVGNAMEMSLSTHFNDPWWTITKSQSRHALVEINRLDRSIIAAPFS